jgi:hypothetical protein
MQNVFRECFADPAAAAVRVVRGREFPRALFFEFRVPADEVLNCTR